MGRTNVVQLEANAVKAITVSWSCFVGFIESTLLTLLDVRAHAGPRVVASSSDRIAWQEVLHRGLKVVQVERLVEEHRR